MKLACGVLDLSKIYGTRFGENFTTQVRNIRTGQLQSKSHHCEDPDCGGSAATKSCFWKLHIGYCTAPVVDEDPKSSTFGQVVICAEKFNVRSHGGCDDHPYSHGFNVEFRPLRNGRSCDIAWDNTFNDFNKQHEKEQAEKAEKTELLKQRMGLMPQKKQLWDDSQNNNNEAVKQPFQDGRYDPQAPELYLDDNLQPYSFDALNNDANYQLLHDGEYHPLPFEDEDNLCDNGPLFDFYTASQRTQLPGLGSVHGQTYARDVQGQPNPFLSRGTATTLESQFAKLHTQLERSGTTPISFLTNNDLDMNDNEDKTEEPQAKTEIWGTIPGRNLRPSDTRRNVVTSETEGVRGRGLFTGPPLQPNGDMHNFMQAAAAQAYQMDPDSQEAPTKRVTTKEAKRARAIALRSQARKNLLAQEEQDAKEKEEAEEAQALLRATKSKKKSQHSTTNFKKMLNKRK